MASLGLPGLAGFWGEFPAILSAYQPGAGLDEALFRVYMVVAAIGTIFAAGYLLWLLQRVAFGTPTEEFDDEHVHDMHLTDYIAWAPILVLIVVLGVYPNLIFNLTDEAVIHVAHRHWAARCRARRSSPQRRGAVHRADPRLARARARGRSSPATIVVVLLVDLFTPEHDKWLTSVGRRHRPARLARPAPHPGRRRRHRGRCSAAPTWSTTSRW